jgi:hypothetical protein
MSVGGQLFNLQAAERAPAADLAAAVTDADLTAALDELLGTRSQLTRILLGSRAPEPGAAALE